MREPDSLDEQSLEEDLPPAPPWSQERVESALDALFAQYEEEKPF